MPTGTLDASKVEVAVTGAVYLAPLGTTLPTDSAAELDGDFQNVGYLSEDGITETPEEDTTEIQAWQNGDVVRRVLTSHEIQYGFTMIETNEVSLKAYYGNYAGGDVKVTGDQLPRQCMVIETIDDGKLRRRVVPVAQVTERGEVNLTNDDATGYEVTVTGYPDSDGVKVHIYAPVELGGDPE
jgi:hypothetical protein